MNVLESVYLAATGLGTLRQLSKSKVQYVPTLGMVIPYLELSSKQEYLVQRIKGDQSYDVSVYDKASYLTVFLA